MNLLRQVKRHTEEQPLLGSSEIWNDTSDPLYNLVAPASQRQQDVDRYPENTAFLMGQQFGPDLANLKVAAGVFSGTRGKGCLAGDFKVFDKLYTEFKLLRDVIPLADLQLYVYSYGGNFDSRIYAIINGNTLVDFGIENNCTENNFLIFDGEIGSLLFPIIPSFLPSFLPSSNGLIGDNRTF